MFGASVVVVLIVVVNGSISRASVSDAAMAMRSLWIAQRLSIGNLSGFRSQRACGAAMATVVGRQCRAVAYQVWRLPNGTWHY